LADWAKPVAKLILVVVSIIIAFVFISMAYQFAFPPGKQGATLELPQLNLLQCTQPGSGIDPVDLAYSYQVQQHEDELDLTAGTDNHETTFTIDPGELPADVSVRLERDGYIRDSDIFLTLLKCRHASEKIQAGDHVLRRNMTMDEIIVALQRGTQRGITITVTPGWRAEQVAGYLSTLNLPQFDKAEFVRLAKTASNFNYAFLSDRPKNAPDSVEGYLFPETYNVLQGITAEQLINRFLSEFDQRVTPDMRQKAAAEGLTLQEAVTLASIVEREAVIQEEGPVIASVYLNRLKKKMVLNADPTVQYAIGYQTANKQWWPVIPLEQYAKVDSPYNTYIYAGLPPGPICEPSLNSILAALEPAKTDYLYFLAKGDGTHVFARTLEEQNANLARYGYAPAPTPSP
jgi:peptidoglycan lytic transglycosylase G